MSVKLPKQNHDEPPNWLQIEWTPEERLAAIQKITAFSSRDWSKSDYTEAGAPDPETWAIYILATAGCREEAIQLWAGFVLHHQGFKPEYAKPSWQ